MTFTKLSLLSCGLATLAAATAVAPAVAQTTTIVRQLEGAPYQASNTIIGVTSTATAAGGGNPLYRPQFPRDSGIVSLIIERGGSASICSGTLSGGGRSVVTAAHCLADGFDLSRPDRVTAYFYGGTNPDAVTFLDSQSVAIDVTRIFTASGYTGQVIDQNDIAVLSLATFAPDFARIYELSDLSDLTGRTFTQFGYGARSDTGGAVGANLGPGRLRTGGNSYDVRLGDPEFGGFFTDLDAEGLNFFDNPNGPSSAIDYVYLADFDNGTEANDASCIALGFCGLGIGRRESAVGGGDSGGPQFINGRLASVTSFGLTFGSRFGDIDNRLNSSFGEFSGYVPVSIHRDFLTRSFAMVPEPSTWAMMIIGFGFIGGALRSRRRQTVRVTYA
jgi:Trypsin/PEP-CTERM motif